ncbi:MAG: hypothetical protein ABI866_10955, partial [Dokdonella sp.]
MTKGIGPEGLSYKKRRQAGQGETVIADFAKRRFVTHSSYNGHANGRVDFDVPDVHESFCEQISKPN